MKRTISLLAVFALVLAAVACGSRPKKAAAQEKEGNIVLLDKAGFLSKVVNYEESPDEWRYLGDKPSLVMFTADWCPACKRLEPGLEELAKEYEGRIYVYKVDVDNDPELAGVFGVEALPSTFIVPLVGDPVVARGALPKEAFKEAIETELLNTQVPQGE